jgi:WD40-like Beta Propeller Repeat
VAAYTQLRLAHERVADLRLPWERRYDAGRLTSVRVHRAVSSLLVELGTPAKAPNPCGRSPGRPKGRPPSSQEYDGTNEAIYTIGVGGGGNGSKVVDNASEPSYSLNGKKIAYLGDAPTNPAIYTKGVDGGGGKVKLTNTGAADAEPSWGSP